MATHPFVWPNHGPLDLDSFNKADGFVLVLKAEPSDADKRWIEASCPEPIAGFFKWTGPRLTGETPGDVYDALVLEGWGDDEEQAEFWVGGHAADGFFQAVEAWAAAIHERCPIHAFEGPGYPEEPSEWAQWSVAQLQAEPVEGIDLERWA